MRLTKHKITLIVAIVAIKLFYLLCFANLEINKAQSLFYDAPDANEYLTPVDNLIENGTYALQGKTEPYAGRLPGMLVPYVLFRAFFSTELATTLLSFFIFIFSLYSITQLFELVLRNTKSVLAACISVFIIYCFQFYWHWDWKIHATSIAISAFIISLNKFDKFLVSREVKYLLISGLLITWVFFLRGFTIFFLPIYVFVFISHSFKEGRSFKETLKYAFVLCLPFILAESSWITRNYLAFKEVIIFQKAEDPFNKAKPEAYQLGSHTKYSIGELRKLIDAWGGDNFWYFENSELKWFVNGEDKRQAITFFPSSYFAATVRPTQLDSLKALVLESYVDTNNLERQNELESAIVLNSRTIRNDFIKSNFSKHYFVAPLKRIKNLIVRNVTQDWPGTSFKENHILLKILKLFALALYICIVLAVPLISVLRFKQILNAPILCTLMYTYLSVLIVFAFLINAAHYQYFIFGFIPGAILMIMTSKFKENLNYNI